MRTVDVDGRLHVEISNISKALVNPYRGSEIPGAEALGLDPGKVYKLLRHPDELEKAASTFNNIPVLSEHSPVFADDHKPELVVGSTGTDAVFEFPYLKNSLVLWAKDAIEDVDNRDKCELSCAYRYRADMTPGLWDGVPYDGVMRDLIGNHVALVGVGRAGPDVVVADGNPFQPKVKRMKLTRVGLAAVVALGAAIRPKLAADAKMPDLSPALEGVKLKGFDSQAVAAKVHALVAPKLAADSGLTVEALKLAADAAEEEVKANDAEEDDEDENPKAKPALDADEPPAGPEGGAPKPGQAQDAALAMQAAIAKARTDGATEAIVRMNAIRQAERDVHPHVGEVAAMDSAEAVYKFALDAMGVDTKGMPPVAYRHVLAALPKRGEEPKPPRSALALDSAGADDFAKRFPTARAPRAA